MKKWPELACMSLRAAHPARGGATHPPGPRGKATWYCRGEQVEFTICLDRVPHEERYHVILLARMNGEEVVGIVAAGDVAPRSRNTIQVCARTKAANIFETGISLCHIAGVALVPTADDDFQRAVAGYLRAPFPWQEKLEIVHVIPPAPKDQPKPDKYAHCNRLFKIREPYVPFDPAVDDATWVKITLDDFYHLDGIHRNKALDEVVLASYQQHQYLVMGRLEQGGHQRCVLGIPYGYKLDQQLQMHDLGFSRFLCSNTKEMVRDGETGYWLYVF